MQYHLAFYNRAELDRGGMPDFEFDGTYHEVMGQLMDVVIDGVMDYPESPFVLKSVTRNDAGDLELDADEYVAYITRNTDLIDAGDPRVPYLQAMPTYYVGQCAIERGADNVWEFASHLYQQGLWYNLMTAIASRLTRAGIDATAESGDSPGAPAYISIPVGTNDKDEHWYVGIYDATWPDDHHTYKPFEGVSVCPISDTHGGGPVWEGPVKAMETEAFIDTVRGIVDAHKYSFNWG